MIEKRKKELDDLLNKARRKEDKNVLFGTAVLQKIIGKQQIEEIIGRSAWDYFIFRDEVNKYIAKEEINWDRCIYEIVDYVFEEFLKEAETQREIMDKIYYFSDKVTEDMYEDISRLQVNESYSKGYPLNMTTPAYINELCTKVMGIKDNKSKRFLDLCSGVGGTLLETGLKNRDISLYGQEINQSICNESRAIMILAGREVNIKLGDAIIETIGIKDEHPQKYDYVFSQPPLGVQNNDPFKTSIGTKDWEYRYNDMDKVKRQSELTFAACVVTHLNEEGKGCLLGSTGMLFRSGFERQWRKQLLQDGKIEAIIQLPSGIMAGTTVATSLLVLSHNNEKVKMIDASKIFTKKARWEKVLTEEDVETIYQMVVGEPDGSNCSICEYKDIHEKDYNMLPIAYLGKEIKNPVMLGKGGIEIIPGIDIIGKKAEMRYDDASEYEALNPSDFDKYGEVGLLKRINGTAKEFEKYIIKKGDLILTAKGSVFKSMVADFDDDRKVVLMTKSLIIVRPNRDVWNPYYIKMFFDSADGQEIIDRSFIGTAMKSLSLKTLGDIELPHIPIEEQNKIAEGYVKRQAEYRQAIATAKECEEKYFNYYDEEVGEQENE